MLLTNNKFGEWVETNEVYIDEFYSSTFIYLFKYFEYVAGKITEIMPLLKIVLDFFFTAVSRIVQKSCLKFIC